MKIRKSFIEVVGTIWMPATTAATEYPISHHDIENMRNDDGAITRDSVEQWLSSHSGDFQSVIDFRADLELPNGENLVFEFMSEDNEITFNDCMYGSEID